MFEFLRGLYARLLRDLPECGVCRGDGFLRCEQPYGLTEKGDLTADVDGCRVVWPGCPQKWARLRRWGTDLLHLSSIVAWAFECGLHRRPGIPWPAERLLREYAVRREEPEVLALHRAREAT